MNHPDLDGSVTCAYCGLEQTLDARVWSGVMSSAHELVDLCGVNPDVASAPESSPLKVDNPYRNIGVNASERSYEEAAVVGGRAPLEVRISPGQPLCAGCRTPLGWQMVGAELALACGACGRAERYAPVPAVSRLNPALSAVAAQPLRSDMRHVTSHVDPDGVVQMICPNCGAPLAASPGSTQVVCSHCQSPSLVPNKLWFRLGVRAPRVEPIWMLFSGPSPRRQALANAASGVDPFEAELQARARAALAAAGGGGAAAAAAPVDLQPQAPPPVVEPAAPYPPGIPEALSTDVAGSQRSTMVVLALVALVVLLLVGVGVVAVAILG